MLILKLKQAECALADERLDEAFDLLSSEPLRQHRRAQTLIGQLARALCNRGQQHLAEDRLQQAHADCRKAGQLAGNLQQVSALRAALCDANEQKQHQDQQHRAQLAMAQQNFDQGHLSVGEEILAEAKGQNQAANLLVQEAAVKRLEIKSIVAKIEEALRRQDIEGAQTLLAGVDTATIPGHSVLARLAVDIKDQLTEQTVSSFNAGRLDLASLACARLAQISDSSRTEELRVALEQCNAAGRASVDNDPWQAQEILRKLKLMFPSTAWLDDALDQARLAADRLSQLRTGPLGLLRDKDAPPTMPPSEKPLARHAATRLTRASPPSPVSAPASSGNHPMIPTEFLLQIDGVGSYLVLANDALTVGPISASPHPDLGLLMNPNARPIRIAREDEDYFLSSDQPVTVSDAAVTHKLLRDGDRITLSHKTRLKFNTPNAASTTATLVVSGARLSRPDINYVILLDRDILIGPSGNNHIRTPRLSTTLALTWQGNQLFCRNAEKRLVEGKQAHHDTPLPMNKSIQLDQISMVITETT